MADTQSSVKNPYLFLLTRVCGVATTTAAMASDVLSPVAPYALRIAIGLGVTLGLVALLGSVPAISRWAAGKLKQYWQKPIMITLAVSTAMMAGAYFLSSKSTSSHGFLADHSALFRGMQQDLGVVRESVVAIERHTADISQNTREISDKLDNIQKETSTDPRKELVNLGISWSVESFVEAMMEGNLEKIALFLQGGMKPDMLHNGDSALLYALQPNLGNRPAAVLEAMVKAGFDLDTHLVDRSILDHWSSGSLPAMFETELAPAGYTGGYSGGEFRGPVLLWITMLSTYRGASESEFEAIEYLLSHGADAKVALSYLEYQRGWLADTTPFQQIFPIIERAAR